MAQLILLKIELQIVFNYQQLLEEVLLQLQEELEVVYQIHLQARNGLVDGQTYFVVKVDEHNFKLS